MESGEDSFDRKIGVADVCDDLVLKSVHGRMGSYLLIVFPNSVLTDKS